MLRQAIAQAIASDFDPASCLALLQHGCCSAVCDEFGRLPPPAQETMLLAVRDSCLGVKNQAAPILATGAAALVAQLGSTARPDDPAIKEILGSLISEPIIRALGSFGDPSMPAEEIIRRHEAVVQMKNDDSTLTPDSYSAVRKDSVSSARGDLRSIPFDDMVLFQSVKGACIEGTLVANPLAAVGVTTILQEDGTGAIVKLGLYNCVPGGLTGAAMAERATTMFAKGTRVVVREPYLKIMSCGTRGVRVDSPNDLRLITTDASSGSVSAEANVDPGPAARTEGKQLFQDGQFIAAAELYKTAARAQAGGTELVALLTDRARIALDQNRFGDALSDSAAALMLAPEDTAAWTTYSSALECIECCQQLAARARSIVATEAGLGELQYQPQSPMIASTRTALHLALATIQVAPGDALHTVGQSVVLETTKLLCNLALCSLKLNCLHTAVASAAACLRIGCTSMRAKATHHLVVALAALSEPALAISVTECVPKGASKAELRGLKKLVGLVRQMHDVQSDKAIMAARSGAEFADWAGPVEVRLISGKGRGLVATANIGAGELIMVQRPLLVHTEAAQQALPPMVVRDSKRLLDDAPRMTATKGQLVALAEVDALVTETAELLSSDSHSPSPPVPVADLLLRLNPRVLPLLGQGWEYFPKTEQRVLSEKHLSGVVDLNAHRNGLYPAVSMMNHNKQPNTFYVECGPPNFCILVCVARDIKRGEELFVNYGADDAVLEKKWGVPLR